LDFDRGFVSGQLKLMQRIISDMESLKGKENKEEITMQELSKVIESIEKKRVR
jgi:hypothetical protein